MKIKKTSTFSKKTKLITGAFSLLALLLVFGGFSYFNHNDDLPRDDKGTKRGLNDIDYGPPTKEQQDAGGDTGKAGSDPLPNPTPQESGKSIVDVTITIDQNDGSNLKIRSLISAIDNSGSCTLTLTQNGTNVQKKADVQALSSSSTCKGFSVPLSELSPGRWQLVLQFENDSLMGTAKQVVEI